MSTFLNKLQIDILKRHVGPFVFCFFTIMFLLLMQFLILYIDKLVGKGLPLGIIIELIITNLAYMVVLAAPMAVLVASLMAFGKFTELNELAALKAAGVNPIRVIKPVLIVATLMAGALILFSNYVLPDANQRARSLFIDIRMKKPGFDLKENEFYDGIEGYTFLVKNIENESDSLYDVTLFQEVGSNQKKAYIRADQGTLQSENDGQTLTLYLFNGSILRYLDRRQKGRRVDVYEETEFNRYRMSFDLSELAFSRSSPDKHSRNDRTMKVSSMLAVVDSLGREIHERRNHLETTDDYVIPVEEDTLETATVWVNNGQDDKEIAPSNLPNESSFVVLNSLKTRDEQAGLRRVALRSLRKYRSVLQNMQVEIDWRVNRIAQYLVEVHKKFSIPIACIIFVLIGAPIGMYTRKGNLGYAALIGTVFLTFYWISIIQGEKLADRLYITPFTGMWFSNLLLGVIGTYMVIRICTSFKISNLWKDRRD